MELLFAITLILIGLALIVAEVYLIPGMNIAGIIGVVLVLFGLGYAFTASGLLAGLAVLVSTLVAGGVLFLVLWRSGAWRQFVLATSLKREATERSGEHRARYLGKEGIAVTPLRPVGIVEIEGERIEAATEGQYIAAGSRVRVVAMDRRRYFVRLATRSETSPSADTPAS
ncbi:NfeD family protein [Rhodothermus profundi]|uniref:NfeD-like C-terminal, partner-binding n=1 Tax=Rhodothermus profundi TaxID=633813 RepID=A0A1M6UU92_9BACT|nr:NfeD family protein [Rhodothermus profundi]SHK72799.1 NfeD-like C-terminal, partner-binding [Rhodothermus profundi]